MNLLLALLDADELSDVPASELTAEKAQPAGGVFFSTSYVVGEAPTSTEQIPVKEERAMDPALQPAEAVQDPTGAADDPDEAAITAAGPPEELAIAVALKLTGIADDIYQGGGSRANARFALRQLLPSLSQPVLAELVSEILKSSRERALSAADQFEIDTDTALSRARVRSGAKDLAGLALVVATEAFAEGRDPTVPADDADRTTANQIVALASFAGIVCRHRRRMRGGVPGCLGGAGAGLVRDSAPMAGPARPGPARPGAVGGGCCCSRAGPGSGRTAGVW